MASKNSVKSYISLGYYHLYNRGVEKRIIFADGQDYSIFLKYLKEYLQPKDEKALYEKLSKENLGWSEKSEVLRLLRLNNFHGEISLLVYALMPNHFHFLVKQNSSMSIDKFTNSLLTRYATYFNRRHGRVGRLFQDVYKAVLIQSEEQLLHLSRYIHRNPLDLPEGRDYQKKFTSLPDYLREKKTDWVQSQEILTYFSKKDPRNSYLSFVEETDNLELLKAISLET